MESTYSPRRCLTFTAQDRCLLPDSVTRETWNCEICCAVETWKSEGHSLVLLREILQQRGLYVHPSGSVPACTAGYLLQMRFRDTPAEEIRLTFQNALCSGEQTWIERPTQSARLR